MTESEYTKLVSIDIELNNHEKDMDKVHEIALLEKNGKRPVVIDTQDANHVLMNEIDRSLNVHWENWDAGGYCSARHIEIKEIEEI